jgi:hypothetical protein
MLSHVGNWDCLLPLYGVEVASRETLHSRSSTEVGREGGEVEGAKCLVPAGGPSARIVLVRL